MSGNNVVTLKIKNRRATIDRRLDTRRRDDINALVESMAANLELLKEVKRLKAEIEILKNDRR